MRAFCIFAVLLCAAFAAEARSTMEMTAAQGLFVADTLQGCAVKRCCSPDGEQHYACPHPSGVCCRHSSYCCPHRYSCSGPASQPMCTKSSGHSQWIRAKLIRPTREDHSPFVVIHPTQQGQASNKFVFPHNSESSHHSESSHIQALAHLLSESSQHHSESSHIQALAHLLSQSGHHSSESSHHFSESSHHSSESAHHAAASFQTQDAENLITLAKSLPEGVTVTSTKNVGGQVTTTTITRHVGKDEVAAPVAAASSSSLSSSSLSSSSAAPVSSAAPLGSESSGSVAGLPLGSPAPPPFPPGVPAVPNSESSSHSSGSSGPVPGPPGSSSSGSSGSSGSSAAPNSESSQPEQCPPEQEQPCKKKLKINSGVEINIGNKHNL